MCIQFMDHNYDTPKQQDIKLKMKMVMRQECLYREKVHSDNDTVNK